MGALLTSPDKSKQSCSGSGSHEHVTYHYGASCMQGWRTNMEDAHSSIPVLDRDTALFAVYDGHGGKEVALYCRENISDRLKKSTAFSEGRIGDALRETFLLLDEEVRWDSAITEMRQLLEKENGSPYSSSGDEDYKPTEDEELLLKQEADIPLDDILAQFGPPNGSGDRRAMLRALLEEGVDDSSSSGSSVGEEGTPSESELSEEAPTPSDQSQDDEDLKSPSLPKPSNGIPEKESVATEETRLKNKVGVYSIDASSNIEVPCPPEPHQSLPSPIHSPDKLSHLETTDSTELEEIETALRGDPEEDRTPLLPDPVSSDEEQGPPEAGQSLAPCKLTRKKDKEGFDSGTTAVVCVIHKGEIIVANVGDSRCVLSRQGQAYPLSFDHKPTDAEELKRITKAGGIVNHEGRVNSGLNLSRAIGDHIYKCNRNLSLEEQMITAVPDINSTTLQPGDSFLLLACDGIFNVMDNQEAVTFVQKRLNRIDLSKEGPSALARICEELCDGCLAVNTQNDGTGCDNMTVVIVVPETSNQNLDSAPKRKRKISGEAENSKRFKSNDLDSSS